MVDFTGKAEVSLDMGRDRFIDRERLKIAYLSTNIPNLDGAWYDAGAGISYTRDHLAILYNRKPLTTDADLNLDNLPYRDDSMDVVTHLDVVEHLLNPLFALSEVRRILKPNGVLYLTTPNDESLIYKLEHLLGRKYEPHFHQFMERDLRWLMEAAGFEIVRLDTFRRSWKGRIARYCRNSFYLEARKK